VINKPVYRWVWIKMPRYVIGFDQFNSHWRRKTNEPNHRKIIIREIITPLGSTESL
jgi:hypothetical protein